MFDDPVKSNAIHFQSDLFPHRSLGVHVNVFANKLQVMSNCDSKNMVRLLIMIYMIETKSKNRIYIQ